MWQTHIQVSENVHLLLTACRCCFGKLMTETMEGTEKGCSGIGMRHFVSFTALPRKWDLSVKCCSWLDVTIACIKIWFYLGSIK